MPEKPTFNTITRSKIACSPLLVQIKTQQIVVTELMLTIDGILTAVTILRCGIFQDAK